MVRCKAFFDILNHTLGEVTSVPEMKGRTDKLSRTHVKHNTHDIVYGIIERLSKPISL